MCWKTSSLAHGLSGPLTSGWWWKLWNYPSRHGEGGLLTAWRRYNSRISMWLTSTDTEGAGWPLSPPVKCEILGIPAGPSLWCLAGVAQLLSTGFLSCQAAPFLILMHRRTGFGFGCGCLLLLLLLLLLSSSLVFGPGSDGISQEPASSAPSLGRMTQKENPGNSPPCPSSGSEILSRSALSSPLFRVFPLVHMSCPGFWVVQSGRNREMYVYSFFPKAEFSIWI